MMINEGLIKKLDGRRIGSGCVLVPKTKVNSLITTLDRFKVKYKETVVWLGGE